MSPSYTDPAVLAFVVIPLMLAAALVWAAGYAWRRAGAETPRVVRAVTLTLAGTATWMSVTWIVAASGAFRQWNQMPPPFALLVVAIVLLAARLAFSGLGRQIATHVPLWALVGIQAFRLPLELAMHALVDRGTMPVQMSYTGLNFDIVTGTTAIIVALLVAAGRAGRWLVMGWNLLGLALLINVMVVAILSTPRFAYFGQDQLNVFVTYPPFVWLPAVMVLAAFAGHLLIFRALARRPGS
jgi:hypothetical protein